ncbi:hypothetical protein LCL95_00515 [Bacillus timonensis]|nr:hypothetical protein [Bacillus timonensis]
MFTKALWIQNVKQSKFLLWALWIVTFYFPVKLYHQAERIEWDMAHWKEWGNNQPYQFHFYNASVEVSFLQMLILITLASVLIGLQRTNQNMDFTLSLPYKRKDIFLAKWALGVAHLIGASVVGSMFSVIVLVNTILNDYISVSIIGYYYLVSLLVLIALYSMSLLIGFVGGSIISQFALSYILWFLPYGFYQLLIEAISYHYRIFQNGKDFYREFWVSEMIEMISFPIPLLNIDNTMAMIMANGYSFSDFIYLIVPIVVTPLSVWLMLVLSRNMKSENNGKLLLFSWLEPVLKIGVIVCFYLFGGLFVSSFFFSFDQIFVPYHAGGLGFAVVAYIILSKLLGTRFVLGKK